MVDSLHGQVVRALLATGLLGTLLGGAVPACLNRPIEPVEPRTTSTIVERLTQDAVDKIDLLLDIDNSGSMADKQRILELAVPLLVEPLLNPRCVDAVDGDLDLDGDQVADVIPQPALVTDDCLPVTLGGVAYPTKREFQPVVDIHVGVMTSSLGSHGADTCLQNAMEDDHGHLIARIDAANPSVELDTYPYGPGSDDLGFLVWDPTGLKAVPPGEASLADLRDDLRQMVVGAGEDGCGFEAPLESWYRFLVDPNPFETISVQAVNGIDTAILGGTDQPLLDQRADFLRPDSLLAIIMLTDENDCSIRDGLQYFFAARQTKLVNGVLQTYHLPRPRAACAANPNDPCCRSCDQPAGPGCDTSQDQCTGALTDVEDHINVRCFDQKRRFGIDFLQPLDRYVTGLTSPQVADRDGNIVANPLYSDLDPSDANGHIRGKQLVFLAGIVGVPWQDIARRTAGGQPDLLGGLDASGHPVGGFQSGAELALNGTWDIVLGDPLAYVPPTDPLMIESIVERTGTSPVTGDALVPASSPTASNPINGKERAIANDDLQYACVFEVGACVTTPDCGSPDLVCQNGRCGRDCSNTANCGRCPCDIDCQGGNPLCWDGSSFGQLQFSAKGYPGTRELYVLAQLADQGIVGSICPAQMDDPAALDFGYTPAVGAIVDRLMLALGGQCLPRSLTPNAEGQVPCLIIEAKIGADGCTAPARKPVDAAHVAAVETAEKDPANPGWQEYCEIEQLAGAGLDECQNDPVDDGSVDGWCYVDQTSVPPLGNGEIVAQCPSTEKRIIRFVGDGQGVPGATLFITCAGD